MASVYPPLPVMPPAPPPQTLQPPPGPHAPVHVPASHHHPLPCLPIMPIPVLPPLHSPDFAGQYARLQWVQWTPPTYAPPHTSNGTSRTRALKRAREADEVVAPPPTRGRSRSKAPSDASTSTPPLTPSPSPKRRKTTTSPLATASFTASDLTELSPEAAKPPRKPRKSAATKPKPAARKPRASASVAVSDRSPSTATRSARTRSVSAGIEPLDSRVFEEPIPRDVWIEEYGNFEGFVSGAEIVKRNIDDYRPYFDGPCDIHNPPMITLEYPAPGVKEEFILLFPKDRDDYQPVENLVTSMEMMLKRFMTLQQSQAFGYLPSLSLKDFIYDREPKAPTKKGRSASASPPKSATPASDFTAVDSTNLSVDGISPMPSSSPTPVLADPLVKEEVKEEPRLYSKPPTIWGQLIDALKARDIAQFISAVEQFNSQFLAFKTRPEKVEMTDDPLAHLSEVEKNIRAMPGLHHDVVKHICEEVHHRTVGPHARELNQYKAWSNKVYGEFSTSFVTELAYVTEMKPTSKVLDLGSGTSHALLQASLLSGCTALGIELRDDAAAIADEQVSECERRARMWGVSWGGGVRAVQGDFTDSDEVRRWIKEADVIICNNYAFKSDLNNTLRQMWMDCKLGCKIVSLIPFKNKGFKVRLDSMDDPQSILAMEARKYQKGAVSWTHEAGKYYLHTCDRTELYAFARKYGW
ncbi:DOT1-domain-containing protein [Calocera viscosa TUFC12733]|uniref:Histone-lysine N-methyltransferase, H3 lysine-79 specific n=1 Tax=Calocera viscosa (strain TUFC12733) TaxID=1330018 RepID=A0A167QH18_CALVF|nr:DOT1-domain-containing protein [Calocera viscosa TUFC12733]